jgi:molybdopterin-guanine dinucleotide biosynthesis protein A
MAGVVLCGGASRRMGVDKALLRVSGELLVARVAARLATVADPVLLAPGRLGRLGAAAGALPWAEVPDAVPGAGPLGGLVAALEASPHPLLAVVAVDAPHPAPALLAHLATLLGDDHDAAVPVTARGLEPLHAVYRTTALPALRTALATGRLALHDALAGLRARRVPPEQWRAFDPEGRFAENWNRPEDVIANVADVPTGPPTPSGREDTAL